MDKYPDLSAIYKIQFEQEQKMRDRITELEQELAKTKQELSQALDNEQLKLALTTLNDIVGLIVKSGYIKITENKGVGDENIVGLL